MSAPLSEAIVAGADGIPFFLEELTRAIADHADLRSILTVPNTIQGVLTARIDRLPATDRQLLEAAAVLGKDIAIPVRALVALPDVEFNQALARLRAAEFLLETGAAPTPTYTFKHALTRDVVYQSIPAERRRTLHADAAAAIERLTPELADRTPEVLAHHYVQADLAGQALTYLLQAGQRALARCANAEAMSHLRQGLALLETLPEAPERLQMELLLRLMLGAAMIMAAGYGASDVAVIFERARAICSELGDSAPLFPALFGLWRYHLVRANYGEAERLAGQLDSIAEADGASALMLGADLAAGHIWFYLGRLTEARARLERALGRYDAREILAYVGLLGHDPVTGIVAHLAGVLCLQGFFDAAVATARTTLDQARATGNPFNVVYGLHLVALTYQIRREHELACEVAAEEIAVARENQFLAFLSPGQIIRGGSLVECGRVDEGLDSLRTGLEGYRRTGAELAAPYYLGLLATAYRRKGAPWEALRVVDEALAVADRTGERTCQSELLRIKGELLLEGGVATDDALLEAVSRVPEGAVTPGEQCLQAARRQAIEQGAVTLELRAAVSLSHFWGRSGRRQEAARLLEESLAKMPESGSDARDLSDARTALAALRGWG